MPGLSEHPASCRRHGLPTDGDPQDSPLTVRCWHGFGRRHVAVRIAALAIVLAAAMSGAAATAAQGSAPRPNILMVVTDDMGWGQPGFNGGTEVGTPNLDRIANEGVKLTQFYASPGCSPTRAALLTGRHYWKTGGVLELPTRHSTVGMLLDEHTIADALRDTGYETWAIGKWHLGKWHLGHLPLQRGFDHHYGMYAASIGYGSHLHTGILDWHRNGRPVVERGYSTFLMAEEAVQLIGRHDGRDPFFLYLAFNAPHLPRSAPEEYLERYAHTAHPDQRAQVKTLDDALGWVLASLESKGILDDTLIVYVNDNGGTERAGGNAPYRGLKGEFHEGGIRVPAAMRWPGRIPERSESDALLHVVDLFPTLAGLAGASTTDGLPLDGLDAWHAIAEGAESPRRELAHSRKVMRVGDWKLLETDGVSYGGRFDSRLQLYNIAEDPYEETNLAASDPAKVEELRARLAEHRAAARDPAPRSTVPDGAIVFGLDENAAYGAAVERAVAAIGAGNTGPVLERLEAVDDTLRLVYDEAVDSRFVPPASAFRVVTPPVYAEVGVTDIEASGADVVLRLASRLGPGRTVGMTYDVPDIDAIRDGDGLEAVGVTWRTATVTSVDPVWRSAVTVETRDRYRGYSSIAHPDQGAVADHAFDYGEGAAYQVQVVMAYPGGVMFQVRNRAEAISGLVLEWAGETLPLAEATWDARWDRYTWGQAWLDANAPSLNASAYARTLPRGSTAVACLRFAERTCPPAPVVIGSGTVSDDATLSSLALSGIDFGSFAAGTAGYTATVGHDVASTQVTATANGADASVVISDANGSTAGTTRTVALAEGSNTITVAVTAEDGATTRTYTLTVTREAAVAPEPVVHRLKAVFGSAPESHDGRNAFTVRLRFTEDISTGFRVLRDQALSATGGTVTRARRIDGRNDLWEVHVRPSGNAAVTVTLDPPSDDCAEAGSVCTPDGRALWNTPSVTVGGPAPLTAAFESELAEHDGRNAFTVRLRFSEAISTGFGVLRDQALSADGGTVTKSQRVDGRNDLWQVHVQPSGNAEVTVTLDPATDDCAETGSVCTSDGRALSNAPSVTVDGPSAVGASVNGPVVTLQWGSPRDGFGSPSVSDYGVRVNGAARAIVSAQLSGSWAWLTLESPVAAADQVTVAYLGSAMHPLAEAARQVPSGPWDGLSAENLTGIEPPAPVPTIFEPRPAYPLAAAAADTVRLDASGLGLTELRDFERLTALERLDLSGNAVSDLSPLAGLSTLKDLDLSGNRVTDLWPLAELYNLERLNLSGNAVTDLQALAWLPNLTVLLLDGNKVADAWPVAGLAKLENLGLSGNRVGDVTALQDLQHLRRLDLTGNPAADISPLGDIESLVWLALPEDRAGDSAETLRRLTRLGWVRFGSAEPGSDGISDLR